MNIVQRIIHMFRNLINPQNKEQEMMKKIVTMIEQTKADEISCDDVFDLLDEYAEMVLDGKNAAELMPLIKHHLDMCGACREEYEALLSILQAAPAPL